MKSLKYILFAFLCLTWGSSYILIKKVLIVYSPTELAVVRIGIAAVLLLIFLPAAVRAIPRAKWVYLVLPGWIGAGVPSYLFAKAETEISSAMTGILGSVTPLLTLLIGVLFFGLSFRKNVWLGFAVALAGAILIISQGDIGIFQLQIAPAALVLLGAVCYALSTNGVHRWLQGISSLHISSLAFSFMLPAVIGYILACDMSELVLDPMIIQSSTYLVILSVFSTVIASVIYFRLVQIAGPAFSSMVSYFIPIVASIFGLIDGESLTVYHYVGMLLILLGLYVGKESSKT